MTMHLALDKSTGDLMKPVGGGITRCEEGRFVVQQVQSKLRTALGEWALDPSVGWLSATDYEKNFNKPALETRARKIILATQGVSAINSLSSSLAGRKLYLTFSATTVYGVIDLTVAWG